MRLAELVSLDYNKIKVTDEAATVVITGKGNKERTVYLNHACIAAINAYMRVRPKDGVKDPYGVKSSGLFKNTDCYSVVQVALTYDIWAKCKTCNNDRD
jgi:site-specific recombinase XerD